MVPILFTKYLALKGLFLLCWCAHALSSVNMRWRPSQPYMQNSAPPPYIAQEPKRHPTPTKTSYAKTQLKPRHLLFAPKKTWTWTWKKAARSTVARDTSGKDKKNLHASVNNLDHKEPQEQHEPTCRRSESHRQPKGQSMLLSEGGWCLWVYNELFRC